MLELTEHVKCWQGTGFGSGVVHYTPWIIFGQVKVIICDYEMGNECDARAGGTAVSLRPLLPMGQLSLQAGTCWGSRSWDEDALCVLGWALAFNQALEQCPEDLGKIENKGQCEKIQENQLILKFR